MLLFLGQKAIQHGSVANRGDPPRRCDGFGGVHICQDHDAEDEMHQDDEPGGSQLTNQCQPVVINHGKP